MTGRVHSSEREAMRATRLARHVTVDVPLAQRERPKVILAVPLEREGPRLVPDPVTYPVVRPDVYKHAHLAREQRADVVHRTVQVVSRCVERQSDGIRTGGERFGNVLIDAEFRANIRAIEEARNVPMCESVQRLGNNAGNGKGVRDHWVT